MRECVKYQEQAEIKHINEADGWRESETISNLSTFCNTEKEKSSLREGMELLLKRMN